MFTLRDELKSVGMQRAFSITLRRNKVSQMRFGSASNWQRSIFSLPSIRTQLSQSPTQTSSTSIGSAGTTLIELDLPDFQPFGIQYPRVGSGLFLRVSIRNRALVRGRGDTQWNYLSLQPGEDLLLQSQITVRFNLSLFSTHLPTLIPFVCYLV